MTRAPRNASARKTRRDTSSRFKGVSFASGNQAWRATITMGKRQYHLGYFEAEDPAAKAYDAAALRMFGGIALTNERMGLFG